jgi:hypothetical protein
MENSILNKEVKGNHYKQFKMQPIELIVACKWDFIQGNIAKYLLRAKYKNGQEDIDKAIHYCELGYTLTLDKKAEDTLSIIKTFVKINELLPYWEDILLAINLKNYHDIISDLTNKEQVKKYFLKK